jgi:hypothetical protein
MAQRIAQMNLMSKIASMVSRMSKQFTVTSFFSLIQKWLQKVILVFAAFLTSCSDMFLSNLSNLVKVTVTLMLPKKTKKEFWDNTL